MNYNSSRPVTAYSTLQPSFYRSPPSFPKPGRVSFKSRPAISLPTPHRPHPLDLKVTVSPQDPGNYTATDHAATSLPMPHTSLESPDNLQCQPSSHASDPTNPAVIAPFMPQPWLESAEKTHILSFDQVVCRLKPLLAGMAGMAGECKMSIEGILPDIVDKLQANSRASQLPGWENLR